MLLLCFSFPAFAAGERKESVYDKTLRTEEIKCGYALWSPALYKDPNSNELKGYIYDIIEAAGQKMGIKIVWAEEAGWDTIVEGLKTRRYDMICTGLWATAARGRHIAFSQPFYYAPLYAVVRANDHRFDEDLSILNDPAYKIAVLEGEMSAIYAARHYPIASLHSIPQITGNSQVIKDVADKKADITFLEPSSFYEFDKNNPGVLRILDKENPLNVLPTGFGLPIGDTAFADMVNAAVNELLYDGTIDRILKQYEEFSGTFLRVAKPYEAPR